LKTVGDFVAAYDAEIFSVDSAVGIILDELDTLGLRDRSLVVLTADHGESLTEHEVLFQHCQDTYDSTIRVPALLWAPGLVEPGKLATEPVHHLDILPTVLELAGAKATDSVLPGKSLIRLRDDDSDSRTLVSQTGWWDGVSVSLVQRHKLSATKAVVQQGWKYIRRRHDELPMLRGPKELVNAWQSTIGGIWQGDSLFDLAADPTEQDNLLSSSAERSARLRRFLNEYPSQRDWNRCGLRPENRPIQNTDEIDASLRALGYLD